MQAKHCWPPHVFQLEAADMPTCPAPDVPACPCLPTWYADKPSCRCRGRVYSTHCQAGIKHQGMKLQFNCLAAAQRTLTYQIDKPWPSQQKYQTYAEVAICMRKPTLLKPKCIFFSLQLEALALLVVSSTRSSRLLIWIKTQCVLSSWYSSS